MRNEKKDIVIPDISEEEALQELKKGYGKAEQLLQSKDKIEKYINHHQFFGKATEEKLKLFLVQVGHWQIFQLWLL